LKYGRGLNTASVRTGRHHAGACGMHTAPWYMLYTWRG